jgi:hypothetical protein
MAFSQLWRYRRLAGLFFTAASSARAFCSAGDAGRGGAASRDREADCAWRVERPEALEVLFPAASTGTRSASARARAVEASRFLWPDGGIGRIHPTPGDIAIQFSV